MGVEGEVFLGRSGSSGCDSASRSTLADSKLASKVLAVTKSTKTSGQPAFCVVVHRFHPSNQYQPV